MTYQFSNWIALVAAWSTVALIIGIPVGIAIRRSRGDDAPEPTEFAEPRKTIIQADFVEKQQ